MPGNQLTLEHGTLELDAMGDKAPIVRIVGGFEERLRRPMGSPMVTKYGAGANGARSRRRRFEFELDAELIVYGVSHPHAHVTLQGEPVPLRPDGSFTVRISLPHRRQVNPVIASSSDGV